MSRIAFVFSICSMSLFFCSSAVAQSGRGKVTLQMSNEDNEGTLTCKVYKVHRSTKKQTYFKKFTLGKKRPGRRNERTWTFNAPMMSRTISGDVTYFNLRMKCGLSNQDRSRNTVWSQVWDTKEKPIEDHYLSGGCTSRTAPCSSSFQWKSPTWRRNNE